MSGESTTNNWWYICWLNCESSWGEQKTEERSRSFGGCIRCVVKYLANDSPNHREEVREMGTYKLPGFKSYLMLTISAKELRASPLLPTLAATTLRLWKGFGPAARGWWEQRAGSVLKDFLFKKTCKEGISSEVESSPCLLLTTFFFFFFKICRMIKSPHGTVVKPLVSHGDVWEYPDVWHQGNNSHVTHWVCYFPSQCFGNTLTMTSVSSFLPKCGGCI